MVAHNVTDQEAYEATGNVFSVYGVQYQPGFDDAVSLTLMPRCAFTHSELSQYIAWISSGKMVWELKQAGMAADPRVEIGSRPVPQEPMVSQHVKG